MVHAIVTTRQQFREYVQKYFMPSLTEDDKYEFGLTRILNDWCYFENHWMKCHLKEVKPSLFEYTRVKNY